MIVKTLPPTFHAGFSPILLVCEGEVGEGVAITLSRCSNADDGGGAESNPDNNTESISLSTVLIKQEQTFNLSAYVQSLFQEAGDQSVCYTLTVNDKPQNGKFYAIRSAAQVGETTDQSRHLGGLLTEMSKIYLWEGYGRDVSVLAEDGYHAQLAVGRELQNTELFSGVNNIPVSCDSSELLIYTNAAYWSEYRCEVREVSYFFTVHVGDRTAKLSGTVTVTILKPDGSVYTKAKSYSGFQDVHFEIPDHDKITGVNITANGDLDTGTIQLIAALQPYREYQIPTVTLSVPASYDILSTEDNILLDQNSSSLLHITINQPVTE